MTLMPLRFRVPRIFLAAGLFLSAAMAMPAWSQEKGRDAEKVPINKIVMFNSGVGYFEHGGDVEGNASVELKFNVDDVNDLLKSMVLQDLGGGQISTVTYASRDPITKTLQTFAIDLTQNPTLAQLLGQIRGERVEIEAPNKITGIIVGVEKRKRKVDDEAVEIDVLNLLTDEGLRSVPLEQVSRIKLLDEKLDSELRQALLVLATGNETDKKSVTLDFRGEGKRPVRIGYIQETPVWKTSYRLVFNEDGTLHLQGWAIVENTTESDWSNVDLTLVSGRPISFRMDLYQPLYVARPLVMPELYASLLPPTYGQDLARKEADFRNALGLQQDRQREMLDEKAAAKSDLARRAGLPQAPAAAKAMADGLELRGAITTKEQAAFGITDLAASVRSLADAGEVGELFQYRIDTPVTLARQRSAMLPIVNGEVEGEKLSIYNESVQAKHPLNGLRLKNITELHLMQGPITVFDGGTYAGDSRIEDLQPNSERLLSYALDLDTEVAPSSKSAPEELTSVTIVQGTLNATRKYRRTKTYTVKNSGSQEKKVLIEQPVEANWTLIAPAKPEEKTRDMYRFAVEAKPGEPAALDVVEERIERQAVYLTNLDDNMIRIYISANVVSEKVKEALREVIQRKQALADVTNQKRQLDQEIKTVSSEQDRIRQNMAQLDRNTDLYNRYVKKFSEQEDLVEKARARISELTEEETKLQKSLNEFLAGLTLE